MQTSSRARRTRLCRRWSRLAIGLSALAGAAVAGRAAAFPDTSSGLVGHWKLNETSGTTASDSSGNGRHGTYVNGPTLNQPGQCRTAASFDGSDDHVTIADNSEFSTQGSSGQTIAAWVKVTTIPGSSPQPRRPIVAKGSGSNGWEWALYVYRSSSTAWAPGASYWQYDGTGVTEHSSGTTFGTGAWVHLAVTYEHGVATKLYVNGALNSTWTDFNGSPGDGTSPVLISRRSDGYYLNAVLDDVRIYNRVLTAADVKSLYSLRLHWKLDSTSGTVLADASAYERDGAFNAGTPAWTTGRRYNALQFSGSNDADSDATFDPPSTGSVAFWFRGGGTPVAQQRILGVTTSWEIKYTTDGGLAFDLGAGTGFSSAQAFALANEWHHIVAVYNSAADTYKVYVDGVQDATGSFALADEAAGTLSLGTTTGYTDRFVGAIDDFRVYDYELSAAEVAELYGLVGWYKLNETSGTTAVDSSGVGNNGTVTGTATWTSAVRGNGFSADYTDGEDYIQISNANSLENVQEESYSLAAWFRPATLPPGSGSDNTAVYRIVGKAGWHMGLCYGNNGALFCEHWVGTTPDWYGAGEWGYNAPGKWHHVAQVVDRDAGTIKFYLNGALVQTATYTAGSAAYEFGTTPWRIGVSSPAASTWGHAAKGVIDDVRVYNRAIDAQEIAKLFGLLGRWKLDETSGTTAVDSSPMGHSGTHTGGPVVNQPGAYDQAVNYDGTDDYTDVAASSGLVCTESVSMSAWVKPSASTNVDRMILNKEGEYEIALSDAGEVKWALANTSPGWNWHSTGAVLKNNRWSHIVVSYDGAAVKTYVNGALVESASASGTIGDAHTTLNNLRLGGRSNSPSGKHFAGRLDELRVYDRALQVSEVAELYGLLGHWKFDESGGTTVADSSPSDADAAFNAGTPAWTAAGVYGNAIDFDGSNDAATTAVFAPPTEGTVAFWLRADSAATGIKRPFGVGGDWEARLDASGVLRFDLGGSPFLGNEPFSSVVPLATVGRWQHIAAVFDADDNSYQVYVDGALQASGTSPVDLVAQSAAKLSFGTRTGSTERFDGALDDFRIYNRKLSHSEVYELYGLMAWYKLDETSGATAVDSTGLGNDGTFIGSPTLGAASNGGPNMGTAVEFNGMNYVETPGLFDASSSVSAAGWVRLADCDSGGAEMISLGDVFFLRFAAAGDQVTVGYRTAAASVTLDVPLIVEDTGWHHFAVVLKNGDSLKLYVDGVEAGSVAAASPISYSGYGANAQIARHGNGGTTHDLSGRIDDVKIFNRAVPAEEAYSLYRGSRINGLRILKWVETR